MVTFTRTEKYSSNVAKELMEMKEDRFLSDFKITIDDVTIPCHKLMLAVHSPVLKAMFRSEMSEVAKQSMNLDHIKPDTMNILLDYIYSGQVTFHIDQLEGVIAACNYLQMTELQTMCVAEVPSTLKPNNVISWMQLGNELDIADFKAQCEAIIAAHLAEISSHRDFLAMNHTEVEDCLSGVSKSDTAHDDDDVVKAAMQWVSQDTEDRVTHLENLLKGIKLENCSHTALLDIMKTYKTPIMASTNMYERLIEALQEITKDFNNLSPKFISNVNEMLVIIGGQVAEELSPTCWYLDSSNQIAELCEIPFSELRVRHSVCSTPGGFAITGGKDSNLCMKYITATKSWTRLQNLRRHRHAHGSICIRGVIFLLGGEISGINSNSVDCLALEDGQWQNGPELPTTSGVYLPRVAEIKDTIYLLDSFGSTELMQLSPESNTWVRRATPPDVYFDVSMTSVNDMLFMAGRKGDVRICAWYNPATNAWSRGQQPLLSHCCGTLVHHDNKVLLLGGQTDEVEEFSIETGTWSVHSIKLPAPLYLPHSLVLQE